MSVSGDGRFDSYFGHYQVLEASPDGDSIVGRVNHELVASSIPELLTLDQSRPFRVTATTVSRLSAHLRPAFLRSLLREPRLRVLPLQETA